MAGRLQPGSDFGLRHKPEYGALQSAALFSHGWRENPAIIAGDWDWTASPRRSGSACLLATRIAVRYVAWLVALGMIVLTITVTHLWLHLILFPLLLLAAEAEYWLLRTEDGTREPVSNPGETLCSNTSTTHQKDNLWNR